MIVCITGSGTKKLKVEIGHHYHSYNKIQESFTFWIFCEYNGVIVGIECISTREYQSQSNFTRFSLRILDVHDCEDVHSDITKLFLVSRREENCDCADTGRPYKNKIRTTFVIAWFLASHRAQEEVFLWRTKRSFIRWILFCRSGLLPRTIIGEL